ncbi:MAG TPA: hypothetical protein VLB04_02870 [Methanotrichaceae archaeon]|nr:hypothetical protein [Methanotrichaceae archaeon]
MNKELTFVLSLMSLMAVATFAPAVLAQDSVNATLNNTTMNNTSLSSVDLNNTTLNQTVLDQTAIDQAAMDQTAIDQTAMDQTALNLSTADSATVDAAPISDMAKVDPELAATASSAQVASDPEGVFKLGEGVEGRDLFELKEYDVKTMEIGIPIKPLRDVGKMVFVCDIV